MANISLRKNEPSTTPARRQTMNPSYLSSWDPFRIMDRLLHWDPRQDMGSLYREGGAQGFLPAFEVQETKDSFLFKADLPGIKESDVDISLSGNQLTISGKREEEHKEDVQNYYAYERTYGSFCRTFTLPEGADLEHCRADLTGGVLTVVLPKKPEMQPRRIALGGGTTQGKAKPNA